MGHGATRSGRKEICSLVTLDAKRLIVWRTIYANRQEGTGAIRLEIGSTQTDIVKDVSPCLRHNALIDQLGKCLEELGIDSLQGEQEYFSRWLLYVNFSDIIRGTRRSPNDASRPKTEFVKAARDLVEKGFEVRDADGRLWHYTIFDKSPSMARGSTISFIADIGYRPDGSDVKVEILPELDRRLRLDIDFKKLQCYQQENNLRQIQWNKYYAYRGLYLTSGTRIEGTLGSGKHVCNDDRKLMLDERHVLVIGPPSGREIKVRTVRAKDLSCELEVDEDGSIKVAAFDGEGLLSPKYAAIVNRILGRSEDASSFQIRMPFTKGMLHCVDFHGFMTSEVGISEGLSSSPLKVRDAFGIKRDWKDVQIILTTDMFKCYTWLKDWTHGPGSTAEYAERYGSDPMKLYFSKLSEYGHALYVGQSDLSLQHTKKVTYAGRTELNYQFLSTLDLTETEFDNLISRCMDGAREALFDAEKARRLLIPDDIDGMGGWPDADDILPEDYDRDIQEEGETEGDRPENCEAGEGAADRAGGSTWRHALEKDPAFVNDGFIASKLKDIVESQLLDHTQGHIDVLGDLRFLSHDLLDFLVYIAENILSTNSTDNTPGNRASREKAGTLRRDFTLPADRFYLPPNDQITAEGYKGEYFGFLRNPHLSRSEQSILRPDTSTARHGLYKKYFGHLGGIVMVSCDSEVPMALGGADYDGDIVRIVNEPVIVRAILRGAYVQEGQGYRRRYPIAIPEVIDTEGADAKGTDAVDPLGEDIGVIEEHITFGQLERTFDNHIGLISNKAIRAARMAYGRAIGGKQEDKPAGGTDGMDECAKYTIATGLEIDAVKTGLRPNMRQLLAKADGGKRLPKKYEFLTIKDEVQSYYWKKRRPDWLWEKTEVKTRRSAEEKYDILITTSENRTYFRALNYGKDLSKKGTLKHCYFSNIDRLPWLLAKKVKEIREDIAPGKGEEPGRVEVGGGDSPFWYEDPKLFDRETFWKGSLDADTLSRLMQALDTYRSFVTKRNALMRQQNEYRFRNDFAKACRLLADNVSDSEYPNSEKRLIEIIDTLKDRFRQEDDPVASIDEVLEKFDAHAGESKYTAWAFCTPKERARRLKEYLPKTILSEHHYELLNNNWRDGFMVPYYILESVKRELILSKTLPYLSVESGQSSSDDSQVDVDFYKEFIDIANKHIFSRSTRRQEGDELIEKLRSHLDDIFGDNRDDRLKYLCYLRTKKGYFCRNNRELELFWLLLSNADIDAFLATKPPKEYGKSNDETGSETVKAGGKEELQDA